MSLVARLWSPKVRRVLLWVLHVVVVIAVVLGLWYVNQRYRIGESLLSPLPQLHGVWLPLLFLLLYVGGWLGWWFVRLTGDGVGGQFADLTTAWADVRTKLDAAGIDPAKQPVFLVLGKPKSGAADFFAATGGEFTLRGNCGPMSVYATRDAVFVVADQASALSRYCEVLVADRSPPAEQVVPLLTADSESALDTADMPEHGSRVNLFGSAPVARTAADLLPQPTAPVSTDLSAEETAECGRRLTHLCRLIAATRRPLCPVNGVIWLLPFRATERPLVAAAAAAVCRADLAALELGTQLDCPMTAVVVDAQNLNGFRELVTSLPERVIASRLFGRSFPLVPNVPAEGRHQMIDSGLDWVVGRLVPTLVYQRFGDAPPPADAARLWRLADDLFARRESITRMVAEGLLGRPHRPPMVSGVYFAATGPDRADQAFAAGVLTELVLSQNLVAWTEAAAAEERDCARMTAFGYAAVVLAAVAIAAYGWWSWNR